MIHNTTQHNMMLSNVASAARVNGRRHANNPARMPSSRTVSQASTLQTSQNLATSPSVQNSETGETNPTAPKSENNSQNNSNDGNISTDAGKNDAKGNNVDKLTKEQLAAQIKSLTDQIEGLKSEFKDDVVTLNNTSKSVLNKKADVVRECVGISEDIEKIFGLSTASAVSSGVGTLAAGGALATGIVKSVKDKEANIHGDYEGQFKEEVDEVNKGKNDQLLTKFMSMSDMSKEIINLLKEDDQKEFKDFNPHPKDEKLLSTEDSQLFRNFISQVGKKIKDYEENKKKEIEKELNVLLDRTKVFDDIINDNGKSLSEKADAAKKKKEKLMETSKKLGNARSALLGVSAATSVVSMGTGIGAAVDSKKLAEKMEKCNKALQDLKVENGKYNSQIESLKDEHKELEKNTLVAKHKQIQENVDKMISICHGFDKENITTVKNLMTATSIVSGVGAATGITGTITSIMANKDGKNAKGLNITSNIMAGITTGTSGSSVVTSSIAADKVKKDLDKAKECREYLNSISDLY